MNSPLGPEARLLGTPPRSPGGLWGVSPPCHWLLCSLLLLFPASFTGLSFRPLAIRPQEDPYQISPHPLLKAGLWCWPCLLLCHDEHCLFRPKLPWFSRGIVLCLTHYFLLIRLLYHSVSITINLCETDINENYSCLEQEEVSQVAQW